jgi:hypothetical protein
VKLLTTAVLLVQVALTHGMFWTSRARLVLVGVLLSLANGWHEQVQGSKGSLQDMMR